MSDRAQVMHPDEGPVEYTCWSTVGSFSLSMDGNEVVAKSTHRFGAHNYTNDSFGINVYYRHQLQQWDGGQWINLGGKTDNANGNVTLPANGNKGTNDITPSNVRTTRQRASSGQQYRIHAYTNVDPDPTGYPNCRAESWSSGFTVP